MANTKGKILIGVGATAVFGTMGYIIYSGVRKSRIKKNIYAKLNDTTTVEGQQGGLSADDMHKANYGFDQNFWQNGKNGILPDPKYLVRSMDARDYARDMWDAIHKNDTLGISEDEEKVMSVIKAMKSQGMLSQVTYAYANAKLGRPANDFLERGNGDLGEDIKTALKGTWYGSKDYLTELNRIITALPY